MNAGRRIPKVAHTAGLHTGRNRAVSFGTRPSLFLIGRRELDFSKITIAPERPG